MEAFVVNSREFLSRRVLSKEMVDRFLEPEKQRVADSGSEIGNLDAENITTYDPGVGYLFSRYVGNDGVDGSYNLTNFSPSGERKMGNYAERPCRINAYGDSFTQCSQVNDGETWQEVLAAHLGEPIRNFGVGGYGVFQAYKRMREKEGTDALAANIILNIWSDDHFRNIFEWRGAHYKDYSGFSGPWAYLRLDLSSGEFEERPNPYPTPESLYRMCDADHVYETYKDAFEVVATMAEQGVVDAPTDILGSVGEVLGLSTDFTTPESTATTATELLRVAALRSSMYVLDQLAEFARQEGKSVLVLLSYSPRDVVSACTSGDRFDREIVEYLTEYDAPYVDTLEKHVEDFRRFRGTPEEYAEQFYIGHYNPRGNHFFAYAVKDAVVDWLDPKPPTYWAGGEAALELLDRRPA